GGEPWLPQPADWAPYTVEAQEQDTDSTLNLYRRALRLRRSIPDLGTEELTWLALGADVLALRRGEDVVSVTNLGAVPIPMPAHHEGLRARAPTDGAVPPASAVWLALRALPEPSTGAKQ